MFTNNKLTNAVRLALVFGTAATAASFTSSAVAQEKQAADQVERVQVTGSRIKRTDIEGASPVSVFSMDDIKKTGALTVTEFLQTNAAAGGFNESQSLNQAKGAASVGIKNLSREYTLVLLNGRRIPKNTLGGVFTDINQLPMAAVERIEVLSDGASAIYGSDAVAGVINIITKKDFDGFQLSGQTGMGVENHDGKENRVSIVAGLNTDKTNLLFTAEHFSREKILQSTRNIGNTAVLLGADGKPIPGGEGRSGSGTPGYTSFSGTKVPGVSGNYVWGDCPPDRVNSAKQCLFDVAPLYFVTPDTDRQSIYTQLTHQLTDDLVLNGQFRYQRVYVENSNGAAPGAVTLAGKTSTGTVKPSQYVIDHINNDIFKNDPVKAAALIAELNAGTSTMNITRRFLDFGNRNSDVTNSTFEAISGFEYNINDDFALTGDVGFSRLTNANVGTTGNLISSVTNAAFQSGALNPFIVNDCNSDALRAICEPLNAKIHRTADYEVGFGSTVLSGMLPFDIGAGPLGIAVGADARNERYVDVSDPASNRGEVLGGASSNGGGNYSNKAGFVELSVPVLDNLELTAAGRHDMADWGLSDDEQSTYAFKATYRLLDNLMFRASTGSGFKAPNLGNLFTGTSSGVQRAIDTKLCNAAVAAGQNRDTATDCLAKELNSRSGGNPELTAERSKSTTIGVVYEPIDNLSFSLDYWGVKITNIIGGLGIQEVLNEEAEGRLTELVVRAPNGTVNDSLREGYVKTNLQNLNESDYEGLILDMEDTSNVGFGSLKTTLRTEYSLKEMRQVSKIQPLCDDTDVGGRLRANGSFSLDVEEYNVALSFRYMEGYDLYATGTRDTAARTCNLVGLTGTQRDAKGNYTNFGAPLYVGSHTEFALSGTYNYTADTKFVVGIRNLLDRDPPRSLWNNWPFYNQERFSNIGRTAYVGFDVKF